jgi:DNA-binding CsgD family transcriptional regulator
MPTPSRKRRTNTTRRRALELLDASREGCTESVMLAHGFTVEILVELVTARLATAQTGRRLGISIHTAKFHVAVILAKLDADSRTEAVARAAHLGLVML